MTAARRLPARPDELTPAARRERAARLIMDAIMEAVRIATEERGAAEEWIAPEHSPFTTHKVGKDGRTKRNSRRHNALAQSGKVVAKKVRNRWLIRRDSFNRYLEREGLARGRSMEDDNVDDIVDAIERGGR